MGCVCGGEEDIQSDGVYLPNSVLHVVEPCLPGDDWTLACTLEEENEFLGLFVYIHGFCFIIKLYLSKPINFLTIKLLIFSPESHCA